MQAKHLCLLIHILTKGEDGNIFTDRAKAVLLLIIHFISILCLLCFDAGFFIDALWSPAGK